MLQKAKRAKETRGWRQPISFGPSPFPPQWPGHQVGDSIPGSLRAPQPWKIVHSIRFSTSGTYLEGLLPTASFSFALPDTVVQASWICTSFRNLPWLSGLGYDRVELYIHGIQYTSSSGEVFPGTFVPVIFENLTDATVFARDERGAPVLGCDIETLDGGNFKITSLSWHGTTFGRLHWTGLSEDKPRDAQGSNGLQCEILPKQSPDLGLLTYRYVPAVGRPGKSDAEYAVFEPFEEIALPCRTNGAVNGNTPDHGNPKSHVQPPGSPGKQHTHQASFHFTAGDDQRIPTLHHIIKVLQDLPNYGVLEAKVEIIQGGDGFSQARRID